MPTENHPPIICESTVDTLNNALAILSFLQDSIAAVDFHHRPLSKQSAVGLSCVLACAEHAIEHEVYTLGSGKGGV